MLGKILDTQNISNNSDTMENKHNIGPPPGFSNTYGTKLPYNKEGSGKGSNFISNSLSFNLENPKLCL